MLVSDDVFGTNRSSDFPASLFRLGCVSYPKVQPASCRCSRWPSKALAISSRDSMALANLAGGDQALCNNSVTPAYTSEMLPDSG